LLVSSAAGALHHQNDLRVCSNPIEAVAPPFCHRDPLIPILALSQGTSHSITPPIGKSALERDRLLFSILIQIDAHACPEPAGDRRSALHPNFRRCGFPASGLKSDISANRLEQPGLGLSCRSTCALE
jgi:hypothetical protein